MDIWSTEHWITFLIITYYDFYYLLCSLNLFFDIFQILLNCYVYGVPLQIIRKDTS